MRPLTEYTEHGLPHIRHVTIITRRRRLSVDWDTISEEENEGGPPTAGDFTDVEYQSLLNETFVKLVKCLPEGKLASLNWLSDYRLERDSLTELHMCQPSLLKLNVGDKTLDADLGFPDTHVSWKILDTLECRNIRGLELPHSLMNSIVSSQPTLRTLRLGQRARALQHLMHLDSWGEYDREMERDTLWRDIQILRQYKDDRGDALIFKLKELCFEGLTFSKGLDDSSLSFLNLRSLRRLTVESCMNTAGLLDCLSRHSMQLHEFNFRGAKPHLLTISILRRFIESLNGLQILTVLVGTHNDSLGSENCLLPHANTLGTLVWEGRDGPREQLPHGSNEMRETSHFITEKSIRTHIGYIHKSEHDLARMAKTMTNLTELGCALEWYTTLDNRDHEVEDPEQLALLHDIARSLAPLRNLRTLSIRNTNPESFDSYVRLGRLMRLLEIYGKEYIDLANSPPSAHSGKPTLCRLAIGVHSIAESLASQEDRKLEDDGEESLKPKLYLIDWLWWDRKKTWTPKAEELPYCRWELSDDTRPFERLLDAQWLS
ncbi:hypothetical protein MMC25_002231 [Agyrium rufum]|nr:hypothetical protein [Agyrium rufum]